MSQPQLENVVSMLSSEECIVTLAKVLDNILAENSYNKKTRKLKLTNSTFNRRVARHKGGVPFLQACKFVKRGQTLHLKRENEDNVWLWEARRILDDRATKLSINLPLMPKIPDKNSVYTGQKTVDDCSIFENSTIATMDDLESEILKEMDVQLDHIKTISPIERNREVQRIDSISPLGNFICETPGNNISGGLANLPDFPNEKEKTVVGDGVTDPSLESSSIIPNSPAQFITERAKGHGMIISMEKNVSELSKSKYVQQDSLFKAETRIKSPKERNDSIKIQRSSQESERTSESLSSMSLERNSSRLDMFQSSPAYERDCYPMDDFDGLSPPSTTDRHRGPLNKVVSSCRVGDKEQSMVGTETVNKSYQLSHESKNMKDTGKNMREFSETLKSNRNEEKAPLSENNNSSTSENRRDKISMVQSNVYKAEQTKFEAPDLLLEMHAFLGEEQEPATSSPTIYVNDDNLCRRSQRHDKFRRGEESLSKKDNSCQAMGNMNSSIIMCNDDGLKDYFKGSESTEFPYQDTDEDILVGARQSSPQPVDDLEKEMATLLAQSSDISSAQLRLTDKTGIKEIDESDESVQSTIVPLDDKSFDNKSFPEQIQAARRFVVDCGVQEEMKYSSIHAHSDWSKLHQLMEHHSLVGEYEVCWGALCILSVVCSDLSTNIFGLTKDQGDSCRKTHSYRSNRSWLPIELVQGLWNLVLSSQNTVDATRVAYVCSKMHDVLVDSRHLEIHEKIENGVSLPHSSWIRVRKEKMVLLGFALPISIKNQSSWMRTLAKAISGDTQFWYGRYALPTIAIAGGDNEAKAKYLLRDVDFIQSRLDIIGIVTGTQRHILDCKSYVKTKRQAFQEERFHNDDFRAATDEEIGYDVALDGCQQVATCLYRIGQVLTKSVATMNQMIELATALRLVGTAVGELSEWELEMQLYSKTIKVLQDCGCHTMECMGDTLLSMGACRVGQGQFGAAMGCYEEAHDIYRQQLGERSEKVALALHHIGVVHCEMNEFDIAMTTFKTSLKIKQDNGMKEGNDEKTADTLCWIGKVYREQGFPEKAKKYFDTARDVKSELCGADSLEVAEILHNIAILFDDGGDFERSLRYYRKSLRIRRAALGDQHEDVCELIACIGNVYRSMGDECTALKALRRAIEIRTSMIKGINPTQQQTKVLIQSYEDILNLLRVQLKVSKNPSVEQDEIASILLKMGHLYDTIQNFVRSDRCFEKSLKLRYVSNDNVKAGQVLNVKGISYAKRQDYKEAMSSFEKALELRKIALGEGHIDVAETLHNMGNCAAKSGDLNDAGAYYDEALRIKRKNLGNKGTYVAQTLHNIGNVLVGQGYNDTAMKSYKEALDLRVAALGEHHVEVAYSLHCIAKVKRKQHDIEGARDNFNAALRIKRLKLPKNHHSIAETLEQLGSLYMEIGEDDEAILCLNGALNIYKSKHGEGVKVAEVYEQLGKKHEKERDIAKALIFFNKALRVRMRIFGEDHISVADTYYHIGKLHKDKKSDHNALSAFQAATKIRKKAMGRNDLIISEILKDAGQLQMKLGQVTIAEKCVCEALRIQNLMLDPRHEKIGECLLLKGDVELQNKEYKGAIESFKEALSIFQENDGEYREQCSLAFQRLGLVYKLDGDYELACKSYERCLTLLDSQDDEILATAKVNNGLGEVYFAKKDYGKAEEYFRDSVEVLVSHLGEDHLQVANAVLSLGRTCTKLNSPDEAIMYFEQARLTKQMRLGDDHLEVSEISLEIGRAHVAKKEFDEALLCFQSHLRARRAVVEDDELACDIIVEIGNVEYELKRLDTALKSLASALTLYRVILGDEHLKVATTLYCLGCVYESKREFKESMKYHKEAFRLRRRLLGQEDLDVAESLDKISTLYVKQPNLEKALQGMREVLRIRTALLGKEHLEVGATLFGMGVIFFEINELEKAMECYELSLNIRSEQLGESSVKVAQTLHNMGTVLGKQQSFESALSHWRRALVAYREAGLSDEDHLVAVTIGNINMAEAYLDG